MEFHTFHTTRAGPANRGFYTLFVVGYVINHLLEVSYTIKKYDTVHHVHTDENQNVELTWKFI